MQESCCNNVIEKINREAICPIPRWRFMLKYSAVWGLFMGTVLAGSIGVATFLYNFILDSDWDAYRYIDGNVWFHFVSAFPYAWFGLTLFLLLAAYYNIRGTKYGYRYTALAVIALSMVISLIVGIFAFFFGFGEAVDTALETHFKAYNAITYNKEDVWLRPDKGLLAGQVMETKPQDSKFVLRDFQNNVWEIRDGNIAWNQVAS